MQQAQPSAISVARKTRDIPPPPLLMQFLGFGLAVAVVLDATIVRVLLVPAIMDLAGRWNWWPGRR